MKNVNFCPCLDKVTDTVNKGINTVKGISIHKKINANVDILSSKDRKSLYKFDINFDNEMSLPKAVLLAFAIFFGISFLCGMTKRLYANKVLREYKRSQKEAEKES